MSKRGGWKEAVKYPEKHPNFHASISGCGGMPTMSEQYIINNVDKDKKEDLPPSEEAKERKKKIDVALRNL